MELKSSVAFALILLFLLQPRMSKGAGSSDWKPAEVYEIDYKGPETHFFPPPDHARGASSQTENKSVKSKPRTAHIGRKVLGGR
ncbi:uncharacterized protein LOC116254940 [Nymphaea colorata]|nr:uncharacterized protein LOC116254940 [Nymphaea colorata]